MNGVSALNGKINLFDRNNSLSALFSQTVKKFSQKIALVFLDEIYTYQKLEERSNKIAHFLIKNGLKIGDHVPVMMDKGADFIIGVLGIIKAGGCYVPIDVEYPLDRINTMLRVSKAKIVIIDDSVLKNPVLGMPFEKIICLGTEKKNCRIGNISFWSEINHESAVEVDRRINIESPLYMIFTSGTSGEPKGVINCHRSVINLIECYQKELTLNENDIVSQLPSFSFDASIGEIFAALITGCKLVIFPSLKKTSPDDITNMLIGHGITFSTFSPTALKLYLPLLIEKEKKWHVLRIMLSGGEALPYSIVKQFYDYFGNKAVLVNIYGPTETTVFSTYYFTDPKNIKDDGVVTIGRPINNEQIYILNDNFDICPQEDIGEICISGEGLAIGYYDDENKTRNSFIVKRINDQLIRLYRTGDKARILSNNTIEFLGRLTNQVKIRGYRVELEEIEAVVKRISGVTDAVVLALKDKNDETALVAYIKTIKEIQSDFIIAALKQKLPDYMIPVKYIPVTEIPMTTSGKIDKNRLPAVGWDNCSYNDANEYISLSTVSEIDVGEIWSKVFKIEHISRNESVHRLGGDSISVLKIVSLLNHKGYSVKPSDVFTYPILADFAAFITDTKNKKADRAINNETVSGKVELMPIQNWFFSMGLEYPGFHHQSMEFISSKLFDEELICKSFVILMKHHEMLRAYYKSSNCGDIEQIIEHDAVQCPFTFYNLTTLDSKAQEKRIAEIGFILRDSISLEKPPLMRFAQLKLNDNLFHIIWIVHHLIIDTVSWFILLEDFHTVYHQLSSVVPVNLPDKTTSYQAWASYLTAKNDTIFNYEEIYQELEYWKPVLVNIQDAVSVPKTGSLEQNQTKCVEKRYITFDTIKTKALLTDALKCYSTTAEELLITALFRSIGRWLSKEKLIIDLEWHGRDSELEEMDVGRTVGWFTTIYPFYTDAGDRIPIKESIIAVKELKRGMQTHRASFNQLRYLCKDKNVRKYFDSYDDPEVIFNYSGSLIEKIEEWEIIPLSAIENHPENKNPYLLAVEAYIRNNELYIDTYYSSLLIDKNEIDIFNSLYSEELNGIIMHCLENRNIQKTPSDFNSVRITQEEIGHLPVNVLDIIPMSTIQSGMLIYKDDYQVQIIYQYHAFLDYEKFFQVFQELIQRHPMLRASTSGNALAHPAVFIYDDINISMKLTSLKNLSADEQEKYKNDYLSADRKQMVDLAQAPLFRVNVLDLGRDYFQFIITIHHFIHDGWSMTVLMNEFSKLYTGYLNNTSVNLPFVAATYKDYIFYQQKMVENEKERTFWKERVEKIEKFEIPNDKLNIRDHTDDEEDQIFVADISSEITTYLRNLCQRFKVTLHDLMLCIYMTVLHRLSDNLNITVGVITSGRSPVIPDYENIIGCCVNSLPVCYQFTENDTFADVIQAVHKEMLAINDHILFPLSEIINIKNEGNPSTRIRDLFETLFTLESYQYVSDGLNNIPVIIGGYEQTNYMFSLGMYERLEDINVVISYSPVFFKEETIKRIFSHYITFINSLIANENNLDQIKIHQLDILTVYEKIQLLEEFNNNNAEYPADISYIELFETQVKKNPEAVAAVCGEQCITYRELNEQADAVCYLLQKKGISRNAIVGILLERNILMLVCILGVWKADAAYMPLDVSFPVGRKRTLIDDSGTYSILTLKGFKDKELETVYQDKWIELDLLSEVMGKKGKIVSRNTDSLRYVLYTSGSTGKPKGVMVHNQGFLNHLWAMIKELEMNENSVLAQNASHCFDISVWQFVTTLAVGGRVVIYSKEIILETGSFIDRIIKDGVTILEVVPSYLSSMLDSLDNHNHELKKLKFLLVTGEEFYGKLIQRWFSKYTICMVNAYGPAEASDDISLYKITKNIEFSRVPIGKPLQNCKVYIVDRYMNLCPPGVVGEICVGGVCVGKGYINDPERSEKAFVEDPFSGVKGDRMYKTGDLGKWTSEGVLEFHGRKDYQVKIRGYRIELGEIENQFLKNSKISEAVVIDRKDKNGNSFLVGFYVRNGEETLEKEDVIKGLSEHLPDYMIPPYLIELESLPINTNGKIDRKALPEVEESGIAGGVYEAPGNEIEEKLCRIWETILGVERVGVNDNFFDLGGDSIKAIQVNSRLGKFEMKVEVKDIFKYQNIKEIAKVVVAKEEITKAEQGIVEGEVILTPIQNWFFACNFKEEHQWNQSVLLELVDRIDEKSLRNIIQKIIEHHDALRMTYQKNANKVIQYNNGINSDDMVDLIVWNMKEEKNTEKVINDKIDEVQKRIDLVSGPLIKVILFKTSINDRLLIVIHHLVVDGISWRILLEDLSVGYEQVLKGEEVKFSEKTASFKEWATLQKVYADSRELGKEMSYWQKLECREIKSIPVDHQVQESLQIDNAIFEIILSKNETERLLLKTNKAYNTEINDILLSALGKTIQDWSGENTVLINLEGHGREVIGRNIDISRTVGWFTTEYPVILDLEDINSIEKLLKSVKENLRRIPNKGIGYGTIKYMRSEEYKKEITFRLKPEISFNYLGEIGQDSAQKVRVIEFDIGQTVYEKSQRLYKLEINGIKADSGEIGFAVSYDRNEYDKETIQKLGELYRQNLLGIIEHCENKQESEKTASDYGEKTIDSEDFEELINIINETF